MGCSQVDNDAAERTRLARQDETVLRVVRGEAIGTIMLDQTLQNPHFARAALACAAGKRCWHPRRKGEVEHVVRARTIDLDPACGEYYFCGPARPRLRGSRIARHAPEALLTEAPHVEAETLKNAA